MLLASLQQGANSNLYTLANAANPDNEVDAVTGTDNQGGDYTITSVESSPSPQCGSSVLLFNCNVATGTSPDAYIELSGLSIGVSYSVTFYAWEPVGTNHQIKLDNESGRGWLVEDSENLTSTPTEYTLTGEVDELPAKIRITRTTAGVLNDQAAIDCIVITPL